MCPCMHALLQAEQIYKDLQAQRGQEEAEKMD
jgi:hypothetical protein